MSRPLQLTQWQQELQQRFPELPATTVFVLALYSFGMILAKVSGLSTVALFLGKSLGWPYHAIRKRLSEFYKEASAKSGYQQGVKRKDFDVSTCFAPLLRWVLSLWSGRCLPLAIDVTNLQDRFHVLCVSVVVRGVAIPVAWKVLLGGVKDPWNPHWQTLLSRLKTAVPAGWTVIVLSDRGLESPDLFRFIVGLGWHPLMRVKKGGKFRPTGWRQFYHFGELVRKVGGHFYAEGLAYTGEKMPCTLLACWEAGYAEPWLVLTDLPPEAASAAWYGLRTWIEQGFKLIKGGGWDWEKTRMEDPARVERLWLVMAVATLWVVAVGAQDEIQETLASELKELGRRMKETQEQAEQRQRRQQHRREKQRQAQQQRQARKEKREESRRQQREQKQGDKKAKASKKKEEKVAATVIPATAPPTVQATARPSKPTSKEQAARGRTHRLSARGLAELKACWDNGTNRLPQHLHPDPWPPPCHPASTLTEAEFLSQPT
jgi:hypothetical protein